MAIEAHPVSADEHYLPSINKLFILTKKLRKYMAVTNLKFFFFFGGRLVFSEDG